MDKKTIDSGNENKTTRERIFDTAVDLFSQKGYDGVSVREITRDVGIKESSLYNHFKSKEAILESIFDFFETELVARAFPDDDLAQDFASVEPLEFFQGNFARFKATLTPTFIKIWRIVMMEQFRQQRARNFLLHEIIGKPALYYQKVFTKMNEAGTIQDMDAYMLAHMLNSMMFTTSVELNILIFEGHDPSVIAAKRDSMVQTFFEFIQARE